MAISYLMRSVRIPRCPWRLSPCQPPPRFLWRLELLWLDASFTRPWPWAPDPLPGTLMYLGAAPLGTAWLLRHLRPLLGGPGLAGSRRKSTPSVMISTAILVLIPTNTGPPSTPYRAVLGCTREHCRYSQGTAQHTRNVATWKAQ